MSSKAQVAECHRVEAAIDERVESKKYAVRRAVGVALVFDVGDEFDLLANMVGGTAENRRIFDGKQFHVSEEGIGIEARDLPRRTAGAARARLHLVFAGVCVRRQMTDVG